MKISGRIEFHDCKTADDVALAVEEALRGVMAGNTSGFDRSPTGRYEFQVTEGRDVVQEWGAEPDQAA